MQPNPVAWFEIYVEDMDRARAFYEGVLRITLKHLPPPPNQAPDQDPDQPPEDAITMWAFPMADGEYGASGALAHMEGVAPGGGGTLVYFSCDDCAVEAGRVVEFGGRLLEEKMQIGEYGFIAMAQDTEGNTIGLHSMQ
jgi:predicted enzyme related to lactoylglutathione lyase